MRIAFIVGSLAGGGAERVVSELSSIMANQGHQVYVLVIASSNKTYELSEKVHIVDCSKKYSIPGIGFVKRAMRMRNQIINIEADVCVSFTVSVNIYSVLSCLGLKAKLILAERNDPYYDPSNKILRMLRTMLYPFADKYVFQTTEEKEFFSETIQLNSAVIPNPINPELPMAYCGDRTKRIVTAARLAPQKNITLLLDSFALISDEYPEYILEIYGDGPQKSELEKYVDSLKLENRIFFKGNSKTLYTDILDAYAFVLSSDYEGMSNSMLEALAMGIPTISTDYPSGGARAAIRNGYNGILVPVGDKNGLAVAMKALIDDKQYAKQIGENAKNIRKAFSITKISEMWINFIDM